MGVGTASEIRQDGAIQQHQILVDTLNVQHTPQVASGSYMRREQSAGSPTSRVAQTQKLDVLDAIEQDDSLLDESELSDEDQGVMCCGWRRRRRNVPGPRGSTGARGWKGNTGARGPPGHNGRHGGHGAKGNGGARGAVGARGPQGKAGAPAPIPAKKNCAWSLWLDWSTCSRSCGGGEQRRERGVKVSPQDGGKQCTGISLAIQVCGNETCPTTTTTTTTVKSGSQELIQSELVLGLMLSALLYVSGRVKS